MKTVLIFIGLLICTVGCARESDTSPLYPVGYSNTVKNCAFDVSMFYAHDDYDAQVLMIDMLKSGKYKSVRGTNDSNGQWTIFGERR